MTLNTDPTSNRQGDFTMTPLTKDAEARHPAGLKSTRILIHCQIQLHKIIYKISFKSQDHDNVAKQCQIEWFLWSEWSTVGTPLTLVKSKGSMIRESFACSILRFLVCPWDVQNMIHLRIEQKTTWGEALPSVSGTHNVTTGVHLQWWSPRSSKLCLASKATQLDGQIVLISPYGSHGPLMASLAIKHDDFYSYVSLPEGKFFAFDSKRNMKLLIVISFLWR